MRGGRFRKYVLLFVAVVGTALFASGIFEIWFVYREQTSSLERLQQAQADAAADKIEQFVAEIERQMGWTVQFPWIAGDEELFERRRSDAQRLLRQVPAITELSLVDPDGLEQLRVSRLAMDIVASGVDLSREEKFTEALANQSYFGPVYYRRESEPYMTVAVSGARRANGVAIAEVNLKFIWDLVSAIEVGETGWAYVIDHDGRLVAHPDISLVLRNTDLSVLPQIAAALGAGDANDPRAQDLEGGGVIAAHATIPRLRWLVFVELPVQEALGPIYLSVARTGGFLLLGLVLAIGAGLVLARRMVGPIQALQTGAALIGGGDLGRRIEVKTGDELEALADQFNEMAAGLERSRAELEQRVAERTEELGRSVAELRALGEVSQAINSSLDRENVLTTIVAKAVALSGADAGGIHEIDPTRGVFRLTASYGASPLLADQINQLELTAGEGLIGDATRRREAIQLSDLDQEPPSRIRSVLIEGGYRAVLAVPLLRGNEAMGALVVRRKTAGEFPRSILSMLQTFAAQSVVAIGNARLFGELAEKSQLLSLASQHKSQFLANMSHELRTPLNAVLGYTELMLDNIYGDVNPRSREVLERVQFNGRHLLQMINDVLDLSKIEAGQLTLAVETVEFAGIVRSAVGATESLASAKGLEIRADIAADLPLGRGDIRRLTQVVLNLVGNAIKFTDRGSVTIGIAAADGVFHLSVSDTGPGIDPEHHERIFGEFQQVDNSSTRSKGGSGLGLSISKRIVEMHGGSIWVESELGRGAVFHVRLPIVTDGAEAAA